MENRADDPLCSLDDLQQRFPLSHRGVAIPRCNTAAKMLFLCVTEDSGKAHAHKVVTGKSAKTGRVSCNDHIS